MKRLFGLFLLPFFLFSCSDSIENQLPIFNQSEKGYILKGTVKSPSESEEKSGRMAVPTLNQNIQELIDDTEKYKLNIYHNNELKDVTLENGIFTLSLNSGNNQIRVEVLKKNPSAESWCCILQSTEDIEIKANSPRSLSKNFKLKKLQTEGKTGSVMLEIGLDNSIGNVTATLEDADSEKISAWKTALELSDTLTKKCDIIGENNSKKTYFCSDSGESPKEVQIDSGSYRVRFDFYDSEASKNILYSRIQTIEVYDGLLTDKWYEAGSQGGPVNNNNGTFTVDSTAIQDFINTTVYVDPQNGSDTNGGTYYGKLKTLQKAVDTVVARNNIKSGTDEFNIFLCGDVTTEENVTLKSQKKITLNLKSDSSARRVISGSNQASKALFEIDGKSTTDTTVNFENIQIKGQNNSATGNNNEGKGGGIYVNKASLSLKNCSLDSNNANNGAGIYVDTDGIINIYENTSFTGNNATDSGGAIYNAGIVNMSAGTIGGNTTTSKNTAGNSGGAVYQGGTFNVSGSAKVLPGTERSNDVYLVASETAVKQITINGIYNGSGNTGASQMSVTPAKWKRGMAVLGGTSLSATNSGYFKITDADWNVIKDSTYYGKLDTVGQTIYVSESAISGVTNGKTGNDSTGRGTQKYPYATIQKAAKETWKAVPYTISVDGTLTATASPNSTTGVGSLQEIPNDSTNVKATSITLTGTNSATINGGSQGSALTISKAIPVTITNLKITGGSATNGGGICVYDIAQASLTLGEGAVVTENQSSYGGGIYISGTGTGADKLATLTLNSTAKICGNTASYSGTDYDGGGVYAKYVNVYMSGSALIGDTDATYTTGASASSKSNLAKNGGGIYAVSTYIYMGYANILSAGTGLGSGYGVCHNYASANGGGIYLDSSSALYMGSGKISKNGAATNGGGIYNLGNVFLHTNAMLGDASSSTASNTSNSNKAGNSSVATAKGGGIYTEATGDNGVYLGYKDSSHEQALGTGKGVIGNSVVTNTSTDGSCGGSGIYCKSGIVKMASGNLSYNGSNQSSSYKLHGGGIYIYGGTFTMDGGTIADNYGYSGGGVYANSGTTFTMTGGTIGNSSLSDSPATFNAASNLSVNGGGVYVAGTANLNGGVIAGNGAQGNSEGGGGVYVAGTATVKNAIRYNIIAKYGDGIYCASANCSIEGATLTKNRIYVASGKTLQLKSVSCTNTVNSDIQLASTTSYVNVTAALTGTGRVATIAPSDYVTTTLVLKAKSGVILADQTGRFAILPNSGAQWSVNSTGYLTKGILPSGMASFLDTLPAGTAAEPNNLKINVASDADILSVRDAIKNGKKYVNVTFASTSITTIPNQAFYQCTYLAGITLPSGITELGYSCFESCTNLKTLNLPEGITKLPMYFMRSTAIESIQIPASLTEFEDWALYGAHSSLTEITVAAGNTNFKSVDGVLFSYDGKRLWWYPKGRTGSYTIPSGTEILTDYCFEEAKLTSVTIPTSVTSMVYRAFYYSKVATVNYEGTKEQWNSINGNETDTQVWYSVPATFVTCTNGTVTLNK